VYRRLSEIIGFEPVFVSSLCRNVAKSPYPSKPLVVRFSEILLRFAETSQQTLRHFLLLPTTCVDFAEKNALKLKKLRQLTHTTIVDSNFVARGFRAKLAAAAFSGARQAAQPSLPQWRPLSRPAKSRSPMQSRFPVLAIESTSHRVPRLVFHENIPGVGHGSFSLERMQSKRGRQGRLFKRGRGKYGGRWWGRPRL
jgi:hypothetical protein